MFKFDFNLEDTEDELVDTKSGGTNPIEEESAEGESPPPLVTYQVQDLIKTLPPLISYSPLRIPLSNNQPLTLLRRDLFDARFQLISESATEEVSDDLNYINAPSDLVPGAYEGGLKTWECSADLAGYLEGIDLTGCLHQRILEVGCGTAVPSLYILHKLFHAKQGLNGHSKTTLHMQDYNSIVLRLVTLPNIVLTWFASPASKAYRANSDPPLPDTSVLEPGELPVTPELLSAFTESLKEHNIELGFLSGIWSDLETWIRKTQLPYNLILTSETIYQPSTLRSLVSLLRSSFTRRSDPLSNAEAQPLSSDLAHLSLHPSETSAMLRLCLVAAKVIYFGVGGGVDAFKRAVEETGGKTKIVFERKVGVSRRIIEVTWPDNQSESGLFSAADGT